MYFVNSAVIISVEVTGLNDFGSENEDKTISPPTTPADGTKASALFWIATQSTGSMAPAGRFTVPHVDKRNNTGAQRMHVEKTFMNGPFVLKKRDTRCKTRKIIEGDLSLFVF
jgi:hypothetical protein